MKAAQLVAFHQPLEIGTHPDPTPGPTDALIKVEATGVCRTEWHFWNLDWTWVGFSPQLPLIPGHEIAGTVIEVGSLVDKVKVGDRVTVPFQLGCSRCHYCTSGASHLCPTPDFPGFNYGGGFAEFTIAKNADFNCVPLPENVDFVAAASLGCRYMSAWHGVTHLANVRAGQSVVVLGAGGMGLAAVQIATQAGAQVIAVDRRDSALELASKEGAVAVINSTTTDNVGAAVQELTGGGAHAAIDCIGGQETTTNGLFSLRRAGKLVTVGLTTQADKGNVSVPIDIMLALELTVVGSFGNPRTGHPELLQLLGRGALNPGSLVNRHIGLEDLNDTIQDFANYDTLGVRVVTRF